MHYKFVSRSTICGAVKPEEHCSILPDQEFSIIKLFFDVAWTAQMLNLFMSHNVRQH